MTRLDGSTHSFNMSKIDMIKMVKTCSGCDLLTAKNKVEGYLTQELLTWEYKNAIQMVKNLKTVVTPSEYQQILKGME